jgi:hypothetical protein
MQVKLLSGDVYSITANSVREAKQILSETLESNPYFLSLLDPETGEELQQIQQEALLLNRKTEGEEFDHYPRLFTRVDGFAYPVDPPEVFREKIQGVDTIVLNESLMYQMISVFKYMCDYLHPYAYADYFPMLSYYHIDTDEPEELLEWSLQYKVINKPELKLTKVDIEEMKGKLFENEAF